MSKNSFRIDDILSVKKEHIDEPISVKKRAFNLLDSNYIQTDTNKITSTRENPDQMNNFSNTDFQKTLFYLLSQHSNNEQNNSANNNTDNTAILMALKQQLSQTSNMKQQVTTQDHYSNEYYTRILNNSHYNNIIGMAQQKEHWPQNEELYQASKRFKPNSPTLNQQKEHFQAMIFNKYLLPSAQTFQDKHSKVLKLSHDDQLKSFNFSSASSTTSSSTSSLTSNFETINSSPRSHLSNSEETTSPNNSTENVSPLDALLHLANTTFTNNMTSHFGSKMMDEASILNSFSNFRKNSGNFGSEENGLIGGEFLHESTRTSHNNSFDSSLNGSNACSIKSNPKRFQRSLNNEVSSLESPINLAETSAAVAAAKRKRKNRTAFTANQIFELEKRFSNQRYLSPHDRDRIAFELSLSTAQVITWFQNRRAKQKRDIEEMKNDVTAAKTLKVIDNGIDGIKMGQEIAKDYYTSDNECLNSEEEQEDENISINSSSDLQKY